MEDINQLDKLKLRIPYDKDIFKSEMDYITKLQILLDDSMNIALSELYPHKDWSEIKLPKKYYNWQLRASVELYDKEKTSGIISYSENGLSWSRKNELLSQELLDEIVPKASAPMKEV